MYWVRFLSWKLGRSIKEVENFNIQDFFGWIAFFTEYYKQAEATEPEQPRNLLSMNQQQLAEYVKSQE